MSGKAIWIAILLILLGAALFVSALAVKGFDFSRLDTNQYQTNTHTVDTEFTGLAIDTKTADVTLLPSEDGSCRVECFESEKMTHLVEVKDGVLTVTLDDQRKWYDYIGIQLRSPSITVYLPETALDALTVHVSTGDVLLPRELSCSSITITGSTGRVSCYASCEGALSVQLSTGELLLEDVRAKSILAETSTGRIRMERVNCEGAIVANVDTGRVTLTDVTCANLSSEGDTGDLGMTDVIATEHFTIERDTGDVRFERCDAGDILIRTSTGDVKGSFLTDKSFSASTSTGRVRVPEGTVGGRCEIRTSTGDVTVTVE